MIYNTREISVVNKKYVKIIINAKYSAPFYYYSKSWFITVLSIGIFYPFYIIYIKNLFLRKWEWIKVIAPF